MECEAVSGCPSLILDGSQAHHIHEDSSNPCGSFTSTAFLNKLPKDLKKLLRMQQKHQRFTLASGDMITRAAEKEWAGEKGAFVYKLSAPEQKELISRVRPIGDRILGEDPKTKDIYAMLKKAAAATR